MSESRDQNRNSAGRSRRMTLGDLLFAIGVGVILAGTLGFSAAVAYSTFVKMCRLMGVW